MSNTVRLIKRKLTPQKEIFFEEKRLDAPSSVHWHDFCELDIIISGQGVSLVNGKEYDCCEGMMVFMSPSDVHDYRTDDLEIFNIQFATEGVDSEILHTLMQMNKRVVYVNKESIQLLLSLCHLMDSNVVDERYRGLYHRKLLENILLIYMQNIGEKEHYENGFDADIIQKIVIYVNTHFSENPMLKDIAKEFHINENYLCSIFHQHMGEKYKSYLRKIKLEHAQKLIAYTDLPMTEISFTCGYITQSHFNREFRAFFGMTPKKMREKEKSRRR